MKTPAKLLVGVDFSETIDPTLESAKRLASSLDARIVLSHAVEYVPRSHDSECAEKRALFRLVNKNLTKRCEKLRDAGFAVGRTLARAGRPVSILLEDAEQEEATAIVVGVSNRSVVDRLFAGSTAEKLVRLSPWPVYLRHPDDSSEIESIFCAVDFSAHAQRTLKNAVDLARALGAELHVLHVDRPPWDYPGTSFSICVDPRPTDKTPREELDAFVAAINTNGVKVTTHVAKGRPEEGIEESVKALRPGLLVLGKHGHGGIIDRVIGGVATHILRRVPCSLLVIGDRDL